LSAYAHWVRHHRPHLADPDGTAQELYDEKFSIHVHVYDFVTINILMRRLVAAHGYDAFRVRYKRNAKDFILALRAGETANSVASCSSAERTAQATA
jgi:hypothetical protein